MAGSVMQCLLDLGEGTESRALKGPSEGSWDFCDLSVDVKEENQSPGASAGSKEGTFIS